METHNASHLPGCSGGFSIRTSRQVGECMVLNLYIMEYVTKPLRSHFFA